ncbi:MAG: hypothetical protein JWL64_2151, partial [Frankiales bacterium]|nr:hypothetical protein [Frankiales bacterium]
MHVSPRQVTTVGELLARAATAAPQGEVIVLDDTRLTYRELLDRSAVLARQLLAGGVGKGGRVGLLMPNDERFVVALFALARIGAVTVPLSTFATAPELARTVRHADLQLVISADSFLSHDYVARWEQALPGLAAGAPQQLVTAPFLRDLWISGESVPGWARRLEDPAAQAVSAEVLAAAEGEVDASDPVVIIYTSGSTSEPKGVVHSHSGLVRQAAKQATSRGLCAQDRLFSPMPFFWVGGLTVVLLAGVHAQATVLLSGCQDPDDVLAFLERERATWYVGWPHGARALEAAPSFAG